MDANSVQQTKKPLFSKLPAKYAAWIIPLILSGLMSATLSFINLLMNIGLIAYPVVLIFLPLVRRLTSLIVDMTPQ
ncbi:MULTISPECIES: DUF2798 domain-containing protein [Acinetobacter]|uniref:DUF2798 domain-containing protein n=1 Tax=Acinetobacter TaxID=469 RepID=UPI000235F6DE|nr:MULTISPECIES: DUF2798 domain-containing protein [Acinetobacter]KXZ74610.1 hypothetical protein AVENLUH8758_00930 [Acinetobacter venetianus]GAB00193.1 hypothetical protein ACT4_001_01050 [Acinetobacter sp. NBRC 100985]